MSRLISSVTQNRPLLKGNKFTVHTVLTFIAEFYNLKIENVKAVEPVSMPFCCYVPKIAFIYKDICKNCGLKFCYTFEC